MENCQSPKRYDIPGLIIVYESSTLSETSLGKAVSLLDLNLLRIPPPTVKRSTRPEKPIPKPKPALLATRLSSKLTEISASILLVRGILRKSFPGNLLSSNGKFFPPQTPLWFFSPAPPMIWMNRIAEQRKDELQPEPD